MSSKFECQKFSPNFFNKSKCQHCFRAKDQHSAEALECNRVSRKISKRGYLFVAPDWDFSIPMNRTKRWQRRWFVLYEDGELTYSVDEHPDTIPQAIIDMTKVVEVSDAEEVTGNQFAIAIAAPDKIHFIKGTCKEESKWWFDVLVMYPRSIKGRQKRNATFPCVKATTTTTSNVISSQSRTRDGLEGWNEALVIPRIRYLSCQNESSYVGCDQPDGVCKDKTFVRESEDWSNVKGKKTDEVVPREVEIIIADSPRRSRVDSSYMKRHQRRENRKQMLNQRSRSLGAPPTDSSSSMEELHVSVPSSTCTTSEVSPVHRVSSPLYVRLSDVPAMKRYDSLESLQHDRNGPLSPRPWYQCEDEEVGCRNRVGIEISSQLPLQQRSVEDSARTNSLMPKTTKARQTCYTSTNAGLRSLSYSGQENRSSYLNSMDKSVDKDGVVDGSWREHTIRGDPDGCGLDHIIRCPSSIPEIRVDPLDHFTENLLNIKKGWLMLQDSNKEWCKRWCILYGSSLKLYPNPNAEDGGHFDSIISMNLVSHVEEVDVGRNYGFKIKMSDNKCHVFSAVTAGIRSSWVYALKNAANTSDKEIVLGIDERIRPELRSSRIVIEGSRNSTQQSVSKPSPKVFSSEEELRTIPGAQVEVLQAKQNSEGENVQPPSSSNSSRALPASPPLNRTVISKVKERARLKTNVKVCSKSSKSTKCSILPDGEDLDHMDWALRRELGGDSERISESEKKTHNQELSKETDRALLRSSKARDRSRRFTLPSKNSPPSKSLDGSPVVKTPGRNTRLNKETKYPEDNHCSSPWEGNQLIEDLHSKLQKSDAQISQQIPENLNLRLELSSERESVLGSTESDAKVCQGEIAELRQALDRANGELVDVVNRLQKATDENESFRKALNLADANGNGCAKKRLPRVGSLSDLTNIGDDVDVENCSREVLGEKYKELRTRFEKAVNEIRVLKKELKEAYSKCDELEVKCMNQKRDVAALESDYKSQIGLMSVRIEDLTTKLSHSEKQLRHQSKQRGTGSGESKEKRRTRSLKGREALTVSKEVENKVEELEKKLQQVQDLLLKGHDDPTGLPSLFPDCQDFAESGKTKVVGMDCLPEGDSKPPHIFVRLNALEAKVQGATNKAHSLSSSRTSLTNEVTVDDFEVDDASLLNKSEGCPSDYEASEKDAPVALISELNGQIQNLSGRMFELEISLQGCKQKVEHCKDFVRKLRDGDGQNESLKVLEETLLDAVKWLNGSSLCHKEVFARSLSRIREIIQTKSSELSKFANADIIGPSCAHQKLTEEKLTQRVCLTNSLIRTLCLNPMNSSCPHRFLLQFAHWLWRMMKALSVKINTPYTAALTSSELDVEALMEATETEHNDVSEQLNDIIKQLLDQEITMLGRVDSWKEELFTSLVTMLVNESKTSGGCSFDHLPTVISLKEEFLVSQKVVVRQMAEMEVIDLVSRMLYDDDAESPSSVLPWLQKMEDKKMRIVAEHLTTEVENIYYILKSKFDDADNSKQCTSEKTSNLHLKVCVELLMQAAFLTACLSFLRNLLPSIGSRCSGEGLCTFSDSPLESPTDSSSDQCPPPRVVGGVMKRAASHVADSTSLASHSTDRGRLDAWAANLFSDTADRDRNHLTPEKKLESFPAWNSQRLMLGECQQCKELQRKVQQMAEKYSSDLLFETERHQANLEAIYHQQAQKMAVLENDRLLEKGKHEDEVRLLQEKLIMLEKDYEEQIVSLKELFEHEISKRTNIKINKANVQRKYRAEIEQLKSLCEKGLVAMEHSHKRIIAEFEEKHRRELQQLQAEKEQALAEETQATLAALDAMRKAHEAELQKEVARFKEEFLQKMGHSSADLDALHREHEEEMETIKHEILNLSEKYSEKCLECAALEEHLEVMTQKLAEANTLIFDMTARNKQLRTHLKQNIRELGSAANSKDRKETVKDLKLVLQMKEHQLVEKEEEIAELHCKLTAMKNHENELENHCRSLDASLKAGSKACEDDMGTLKARLEHIILSHQPGAEAKQELTQVKEKDRSIPTGQLSEPKSKKGTIGQSRMAVPV